MILATKKALGKGVSALFFQEEENDGNFAVSEVDINFVEPNPHQPRRLFDENALVELAESIRNHGVIQPLIVKKVEDYYEIIAGERRFRAARIAGLKKIPVIVKNYDSFVSFQISLVENLQREDLNAIEEALSYKRLMEDFSLTQEEIAEKVGKSRSTITNALRLLHLDEKIQNFILENKLSAGHGRSLLPLEDKNQQLEIAEKIIEECLSVRETEYIVKKRLAYMETLKELENAAQEAVSSHKAPDFSDIETVFRKILGTKVNISKKKNKGKIEIEYYSDEDLDRLLLLIKKLEN